MKFTPNPERRQAHEYWLTWIITIIIGVELVFAITGFVEGREQLQALKNQARDLETLNNTLQDSIRQTHDMADVLAKQSAILNEQEEGRLASLRRRPDLLILSGGADLMNHSQLPKPCLPLKGRGDIAGCSISIVNRGDLPLTHGILRVWDSTGSASLSSNIPATDYSRGTGLRAAASK